MLLRAERVIATPQEGGGTLRRGTMAFLDRQIRSFTTGSGLSPGEEDVLGPPEAAGTAETGRSPGMFHGFLGR